MTDASAAPPPAAPSIMDCAEIYYAPSGVFARRRQGKFGLPLLVFIVLMVVVFLATKNLMQPLMDLEFNRAMAAQAASNPQITPERMESMRAISQKFAVIGIVVSAVVSPLLAGLVIWLVARLAGAALGLAQGMVIGVFALFPLIAEQVVTAVQLLVLSDSGITSRYSLSLGPARFLEGTSRTMQAVVGHVDLFTLWMALLVFLGVKVIGRTSNGTAGIVAVITWILGAVPAVFGAMRAVA